MGAAGPAGTPGPQGLTGLQGIVGQTGLKGDTGSPGSRGLQGPAGIPGVQGSTGASGPVGTSGPTGPQGDVGSTGPQGLPGTNAQGTTVVQLCPNLGNPAYGYFLEDGLCIGGKLYGVYSANGEAALTELPPGTYASTAPQTCTLIVNDNCVVTQL